LCFLRLALSLFACTTKKIAVKKKNKETRERFLIFFLISFLILIAGV